jgi:hypothetical protein
MNNSITPQQAEFNLQRYICYTEYCVVWDYCCTVTAGSHHSSRRKYIVYTYRHIERERPTRRFETSSVSSVRRKQCLPVGLWCQGHHQVIYCQYTINRITSHITFVTIIMTIIIKNNNIVLVHATKAFRVSGGAFPHFVILSNKGMRVTYKTKIHYISCLSLTWWGKFLACWCNLKVRYIIHKIRPLDRILKQIS